MDSILKKHELKAETEIVKQKIELTKLEINEAEHKRMLATKQQEISKIYAEVTPRDIHIILDELRQMKNQMHAW